MTSSYDDEPLPIPLLPSRAYRRSVMNVDEAEADSPLRLDYRDLRSADRMRPATAGALAGLVAGLSGLGVVHALHLERLSVAIERLAASLGLPPDAATPLAYVAAAVGGAVLGAGFASMTQHLRRSWMALLFWAVVFFVSLTTLALALSSAYGRGLGVSMAPAILLASVAYAFVVSFQLLLRRRA